MLLADDDDDDEGEEGHGSIHLLQPVANAAWAKECAGCHMLYHPGLLPARSWQKMMTGLDKHFGENASLDAAPAKEITDFLVRNSADRRGNLRSGRIAESTAGTPLRISETGYFLRKHDEISSRTFERKAIGGAANCVACHRNAEKDDFREEGVRIPR